MSTLKIRKNDFKKYVEPYTSHEIENWNNGKVLVPNNEKEIIEFVIDSNKISTKKELRYGKLKSKTVIGIKKELKINLKYYNISLKNYAVRHIFIQHSNSKEKLRGQVPVVKEDFILIPEIISKYDNIKIENQTHQGMIVLRFTKIINNNYNLICNISKKNMSLEIQTMYIKKEL